MHICFCLLPEQPDTSTFSFYWEFFYLNLSPQRWVLIGRVGLFVWLVVDDWCWLVLREKYCWLITSDWFVLREKYYWLIIGGWFVQREKYCWLVADKPASPHPQTHTHKNGVHYCRPTLHTSACRIVRLRTEGYLKGSRSTRQERGTFASVGFNGTAGHCRLDTVVTAWQCNSSQAPLVQ
jgi:hypothetical protein